MRNSNKISIIVTVLTVLAFAISVDHAVAQKLSKEQKAADKAQEDATQSWRDAKTAQENADNAPKSDADKAAEKADQQAEKDVQAARDAQDKADASQAAKDAGEPNSAQKAADDQAAADKANDQAQKSEDAAKKADEKADKGEKKDNPQKINREKQREKRKKAQEAWNKQRKLKQLKALTLGPTPPSGTSLATLASTGQVKVEISGTGETIGHIADLKIQTDQPLTCAIPPVILESVGGKNQDYACPVRQTVALNPHQTKTVPMNGVCLNRNKPPVGKGVSGDLVINEANPSGPQNPSSHLPPADAAKLLRICTSKYDAADKLQKDGALKNLPYKDKQKQKDICVQWSTWMDPRISEITGAPPATKDDLKKVVYKQVEEKGPMSPETKKKVDQGIDTIFEKIELTTAKAKDLEAPQGATTTEGQPPVLAQQQPEYVGQTRAKMPTATPKPEPGGGKPEPKGGTTEEKPKPEPCKDECKEGDVRNCDAEVQVNLAPGDVDPDWLKSVQKAEKLGKKALQEALKKLPGPFNVFGKTYAELLKNMPDFSKIAEGMAKKQGVDVWVMVVCNYEKCEKVPCEKKTKWAWVKHTDENKPHKLTPPDYAALHEGKKAFDPQLKDEKLHDAIAKAIDDDEDVKKEKEACEAICK